MTCVNLISSLRIRMTVIEHFWFYGRLRGRSSKKVAQEAEEMVESLGLSEKRNAISSSLSGGMKRKLSVATAFVGKSNGVELFGYKYIDVVLLSLLMHRSWCFH